jgi:hypothetical protein
MCPIHFWTSQAELKKAVSNAYTGLDGLQECYEGNSEAN